MAMQCSYVKEEYKIERKMLDTIGKAMITGVVCNIHSGKGSYIRKGDKEWNANSNGVIVLPYEDDYSQYDAINVDRRKYLIEVSKWANGTPYDVLRGSTFHSPVKDGYVTIVCANLIMENFGIKTYRWEGQLHIAESGHASDAAVLDRHDL